MTESKTIALTIESNATITQPRTGATVLIRVAALLSENYIRVAKCVDKLLETKCDRFGFLINIG